MPKKRARQWGEEYRSSDDEDYLPPGSPDHPKPARRRPPRTAPDADEDVPLAIRRRSLLATTGPSATPASHLKPSQRTADLPLEVLHNILQQACAEGGGVPTAAVASCVCRAWRAAVASCPALWTRVDLSYGWARPTDDKIANAAPRWGSALCTLSLSGCGRVSEAGLTALATACPHLSALDLSSCMGFRDAGLADALCTMLSRPATPDTTPLRSLNLSFAQITPKGSGLDIVLKRVLAAQAENPTEGPVLEKLIVKGCPALSHRPFKGICDASVAAGRPLLGALRELSLAGSAGLCGDFAINVLRLQLAAPALERLNLCHVARALGCLLTATAGGLPEGMAATAAWPNLRSLRITDSLGAAGRHAMFDLQILGQMVSASVNLEELTFVGFGRVYLDELAAALPPAGAPLRRLTLDGTLTATESDTHTAPSLARLFFLVPWLLDSLEEFSAVGCGGAMDDAACAALAGGAGLRAVDARETAVGEAGVRVLLDSAHESGLLGPGRCQFELDIASCRGVERRVRQAASRGTGALARELGYIS